MLLKEYRICMPMTVEEYRRGQLYMINRHSSEQSVEGEGVEVISNEPCHDDNFGNGQYTEKRIHLNNRLPSWGKSFFPSIYVVEKAWNYYPYTITEYSCPWMPRLQIHIETRYENNKGENDDFSSAKVRSEVPSEEFEGRSVEHVDLAFDPVPEKHYKADEDIQDPIMCSYKLVEVKFEVWGMQGKVENYIHKVIRDILVLGHRQAFAWIDIWYDMTFDNIREYENNIQAETNLKVKSVETEPSPKSPKSGYSFFGTKE